MDVFKLSNLSLEETNSSQSREWINVVETNLCQLDGQAITDRNSRFRSSNRIDYSLNTRRISVDPDATGSSLTATGEEGTATASAAAAIGDTAVGITSPTIPVYSGHYLVYGSSRVKIISGIDSGVSTTITTEPLPEAIADTDPLVIAKTVQLDVHDCELGMARTIVDMDGTANSKVLNPRLIG